MVARMKMIDDNSAEGLPHPKLMALASKVVSTFVANHTVAAADLPALIERVYGALAKAAEGDVLSEASKPKPVVSIKDSVTPDYIVCLDDGKRLKLLKRHLRTVYGMTPDEYRTKWGLPHDYPMVAPKYAESRSTLAKKIGLGRQPSRRNGS